MAKLSSIQWDVIIIGGGPAGFFAGIRCAELNPDLHVLIIEKAQQTLGKVLISGGGRCNVTHACFDPAQLISYYPRGGAALRGAFTRFQPEDTIRWFEKRGVRLKTEGDGRMFPVTDSSATIADCLRESAKKAGVTVQTGTSLQKVDPLSENGFRLEVRNEAQEFHLQTKKLLLAAGSDPKIRDMIKSLGHAIEEPVPSLFTFNISDKRLEGLSGVSVESVTVKMDSLTQRGPLLITHWGVSGPAILRLSAWGARTLFEKKYRAVLIVNWLGDTSFDKAIEYCKDTKSGSENTRKSFSRSRV
ncbi:MAG: aminoacetone oxidase family FAD-binding enzyme [Anaerolineales bacterium]|nr:aminoacetone oxidase family FAD-binding enzyme [Anaerolineales bacterium]